MEAKTFTAASGGGMVTATVNGKHELVGIEIKPEAVDPDDVEMLQDMVIAAVNEATRAADAEAANNHVPSHRRPESGRPVLRRSYAVFSCRAAKS